MVFFNPPSRAAMEWVGSAAAVCTTVSFVPQLLRVWRRKSASDISLVMFLLFNLGLFLWLLYGIGIGAPSIIAANTVTLALALAILALKLRYDRNSGP
jgi:MtN3 and saliva related transmembrane protein